MVAILKKFRATVGTTGNEKEYFFLQNPTSYEGSLDTATGIKEATETEQDEPNISVAALLNSGKLFRVNVRYTGGPTGFRNAKLLVTRDRLGTALDTLVDKSFRGGTIVKASIPGKATYF
jgi:hypothetical protein